MRVAETLIGYEWSDVPWPRKCVFCSAVLAGTRPTTTDRARVVGGAAEDPAEGARRTFDRAVAAERRAIGVHENAATMHRHVASRLDAAAESARDADVAAELTRRADAERRLALDAWARGDVVRRRLRAEGVDPESE